MLLPLQGVNTMIIRVPQGVASLALGVPQGVASLALSYVLLGFQPVHYRLHLNNSSKLDCIRFAR